MKRITVMALLVAGLLMPGMKAVSALQAREAPTVAYVVKPGDNLWTIASRVDAEADRRSVVQDLIELNDLSSSSVVPGQPLRLPAR